MLLAVVAGAIAFPWHSVRERWVLGIAIVAVIVLLARWQGLPVTTILRRRLAILRPNRGVRRADESVTDVRTTALLRVTPPLADADALPLSLIAGYAERYGLRADAIRVTSRDSTSEVGTRERETWIGVTLSAADNLAALQARSAHIPLHETAEVAARRLADHLRESGWTAALAAPDDVPAPYPKSGRETWSGVCQGSTDYVAAYGVKVDTALPNTLAAIWSYPVREVWTAAEVTGAGDNQTLAVACAFRTDASPARERATARADFEIRYPACGADGVGPAVDPASRRPCRTARIAATGAAAVGQHRTIAAGRAAPACASN